MKSTTSSMRCPRCRWALDETDENRLRRAEAYALGTACTLAGREMSSMPFGGGRIGSRIDEAVMLEPKNPRVRLVEALAMFERAGKDAGEKAAALKKLQAVTVMFEAARAARVDHAGVGRGRSLCVSRPCALRPARRGRGARSARTFAADRAGVRVRAQADGANHPLKGAARHDGKRRRSDAEHRAAAAPDLVSRA